MANQFQIDIIDVVLACAVFAANPTTLTVVGLVGQHIIRHNDEIRDAIKYLPAQARKALPAIERSSQLLDATPDTEPAESRSLDDEIAQLPARIEYQQMTPHTSSTAVPLGIMPDGTTAYLDLLHHDLHVGLYGTSGAGKDNLLRCWFLSLTARNTPQQLQFALLDGKGDWLTPNLQHVSHMFFPPAGGYGTIGDEHIMAAVQAIDAEAARRHELIRQAGCRTREAYNQLHTHNPLPLLVVVATDVMTSVAGDVERLLVSLVSKARSLGIRVIVSMQTPTGKNTQWRMNLSTVVAGSLQHGSQDAPALGIDPKEMRYRPSRLPDPKSNPGLFVVRRGSEQLLVKAPYISDTLFDKMVTSLPTRPVQTSPEDALLAGLLARPVQTSPSGLAQSDAADRLPTDDDIRTALDRLGSKNKVAEWLKQEYGIASKGKAYEMIKRAAK
jgi:hypothetical protein